MATEKEVIILDFQVDTTEAVTSIASLTKANKELREERKNLDLTTKEGKARIDEINKSLDNNTKTIKDHSSAIEKSRMNVGNYAEAIDKAIPGLGGMAQGIVNSTKAAIAFIATPLGAILGAIGAAVYALTAYFKGSEEGQNKWNKVVAIGNTLLEKLKDVVESVGGFLVDMFENPLESLKSFGQFLQDQIVNRVMGLAELIPNLGHAIELLFEGKFSEAATVAGNSLLKITTGVEDVIGKVIAFGEEVVATTNLAIEQGKKLADLQAQLDKDDRDLIVERAQTQLEVSKLREEALHQEGEAKRNTILEAIDLETQLSDAEVAHAEKKLEQAQLELQANGDDKEAKLKVAQATADVMNAENSRYANTLKLSKEIEALDNAEATRRKKMAVDYLGDIEKTTDQGIAISKKGFEERKGVAISEMEVDNTVADHKTATASQAYGSISGLLKSFQTGSKSVNKSLAIADAGLAITRIFASPAVPFIEPFATITKIAQALIVGGKTKNALDQIDKAAGGGSFMTSGPQLLLVGDNPGGRERVDVTPVSGRGQTRIGYGGMLALAGGGSVFTDGSMIANSSAPGGQNGMDLPPIYVSVKEINDTNSRISRKVSVVEA